MSETQAMAAPQRVQHMLSELERHWGPYTRDKPMKDPDLEDEWHAELVSMSHDEFVEFMTWVWSD